MSNTAAFAGSVPANYDQYLGPVLFEPYAIDIAERINKTDYRDVLEVACGTGRVTRHLLQCLPDDGKLVATDLNGDMIAVARTIVKDARIKWLIADAQDLSFPDDSFDHLICQFGVMFFPDKPKAFREAHRVLGKNGLFLFNVWDSLDSNPRSAIIKTVMEKIMGEEAPDFLSKGPYSFYNREEIHQLLDEAGFRNINLEVVPKTSYYPSANDLIKGFVEGSPLGAYLIQLPADLPQEIKRRLYEEIVAQFGENRILAPMQAIVCSATK